ncbi:GD14633 [Drosophila simulans]|uniref:GD14633 n=1 Tax=Drosophila simulans TaxID=7240 RepID=B4QME2_DROSI|nr:GD14633 [Drosophila simulans]
MKYPLLLLGSLSLAHGLALYYPYAYTAEGSAVFTPTQRQYIAKDELGQYSYGYSEPLSSKQETRTLDGITQGYYSYRDAGGKLQTVNYVADNEGFHVAATNLPKAKVPQESLEFSPRSASHPVEHHVEHHAEVSHPVVQHPIGHHPVEVPHHHTVVESGRSAHPDGHHPVEHHDHSVSVVQHPGGHHSVEVPHPHTVVESGRSAHPDGHHPVEHHEHPVPVAQHPLGHHPVEVPHHHTVVESGRSAHPEGHHPIEHHEHAVSGADPSGSHGGHSQLPHPVADTAEVAAAKSLHLQRVHDEGVRNQVLAKIPVAVARSHHIVVPAPVYGYTIPRYYTPGFYY